MGTNKDPRSNVKCRSVLHLASSTMQMVTEQLPRVDTRSGPAAGADESTTLPPMASSSQGCVSLLGAAVFQPTVSPELYADKRELGWGCRGEKVPMGAGL